MRIASQTREVTALPHEGLSHCAHHYNLCSLRKIPKKFILARNFFKLILVRQDKGRKLAGKEVINMKSIKALLSVVFLTGAMGLSAMSVAADGVISKDVIAEGSYCHMKFPAIREKTLDWNRPALKDASSADIIDFYGPCDHDPLG